MRCALTALRRDERGIALVLSLLVLLVLAIALTSIIYFTSTNSRSASYSKADQTAIALAEAGINNALAIVSNPANGCCLIKNDLMPNSEPTAYSKPYQGGTVKWWGTLDDARVWTVYGKATVPNPTGPSAAPITKTMKAKVQVHSPNPAAYDLAVWNTIYSPGSGSGGCDTTVAQGVAISAKLWVGGNLCVENGAQVQAPMHVGGWLSLKNPSSAVGSRSNPLNSAHVGGSCQWQQNPAVGPPCKSEPGPPSPKTNVWVKNPTTWDPSAPAADLADVTAPTICWAQGSCSADPVGGWYVASSPGPLQPCKEPGRAVTPPIGSPPVFDTNTTWGPFEGQPGGSVPGTFNLTPTGQSYTCKTANGELSWDWQTRTLTVAGTIFIDGSVYATTTGNAPITYTGWGHDGACTADADCEAVIFVTGTVNITSEKLCAKVNSSTNDCDWTGWDPNKKILIFAAHYQGTQTGVGAGQGITVGPTQTSFQGGLYADYEINTGQGAATQGPLVSGTKTVVTGQQFQGFFPELTILPLSIQQPPGSFWVDPPYDFDG